MEILKMEMNKLENYYLRRGNQMLQGQKSLPKRYELNSISGRQKYCPSVREKTQYVLKVGKIECY
jgi:hypothetical protein